MAGHPTLFSCQVNTAEQLGNEVTRVLGGWKHALLFFVGAGDWCKWCNALTADMAANPVLQEFCAARGIEMIGVNLVRKDEDTTGLRIAYQIKSIPTLILLGPAGAELARTEYLDSGVAAYIPYFTTVLPQTPAVLAACGDDEL